MSTPRPPDAPEQEEAITIGPGVIVTVRDHQVVRVTTCGSRAAAEDAVHAFVDADPYEEQDDPENAGRDPRTLALGYEQAIEGFGEWRRAAPSGWLEAEVRS